MSLEEKPKKTLFRRYVGTVMAAVTVGAVIYGSLTGIFTTVEGGFAGGIIVGLAIKFLWEENG